MYLGHKGLLFFSKRPVHIKKNMNFLSQMSFCFPKAPFPQCYLKCRLNSKTFSRIPELFTCRLLGFPWLFHDHGNTAIKRSGLRVITDRWTLPKCSSPAYIFNNSDFRSFVNNLDGVGELGWTQNNSLTTVMEEDSVQCGMSPLSALVQKLISWNVTRWHPLVLALAILTVTIPRHLQ